MKIDGVKEIFDSDTGRRLITCLLLANPITAQELEKMILLSLNIFNPKISRKRPFPNVSTINFSDIDNVNFRENLNAGILNESEISKNLFTHADLYSSDRILKKAIECGLILKKDASSASGKISYYFLNSDLHFFFDNRGLQVKYSSKSLLHKIKYEREIIISQRSSKKEIIPDRLSTAYEPTEIFADNRFFPIGGFLRFFWWAKNHWNIIYKTIRKYYEIDENGDNSKFTRADLPDEWHSSTHLISKALKDYLFVEKDKYLSPMFLFKDLTEGGAEFCFNRTYEILKCFSNFENHLSDVTLSGINA